MPRRPRKSANPYSSDTSLEDAWDEGYESGAQDTDPSLGYSEVESVVRILQASVPHLEGIERWDAQDLISTLSTRIGRPTGVLV